MLMITSDSQKHREQVAFLLVRVPTRPRPRLPHAQHQAWSGWVGPGGQTGCLGGLGTMTRQVSAWSSKMPLYAPSPFRPQKLIQRMRDEIHSCFSGIIQEVRQLQMKVLDFVEKEEAAALEKLGSSIQQSHNWLLKLEADSIWLRTLLTNPSDQQFLQARPHPTSAPGPATTSTPPTHTPSAFRAVSLVHSPGFLHLSTQPDPNTPAFISLERKGCALGFWASDCLSFYTRPQAGLEVRENNLETRLKSHFFLQPWPGATAWLGAAAGGTRQGSWWGQVKAGGQPPPSTALLPSAAFAP